jgi:regulator of sigma E protease
VLLTIVAFLVVIGVLVTIHEAGHFFAAKAVGIQVPRFSIGFGPKLVGFRRGETEYIIAAIPLGGYVKMAGMEDDEAQSVLEGRMEDPVDPERTFDSKPLWARAMVISAGVIVNFVFAVLVFIFLNAAYGEQIVRSTRVSTPDPATATGAAAEAAKIPSGSTIAAVGGARVESLNDALRGIGRAPSGPLPVALDGGRTVTLTLPDSRVERLELVGAIEPLLPAVVQEVLPGGAAGRAGLRAGDRIVAVDGRPVLGWNDFVRVVRASPAKTLRVEVQRGAGRAAVSMTPTGERETGPEGNVITVGKIGARQAPVPTVRRPIPFGRAVRDGWGQAWGATTSIVEVLQRMISGQTSARQMGGLLAIGEASGEAARRGLDEYLFMLAFLSINLAVLNLLPIPVLDGGHLMFLAIEAVRGRPLSVETRIRLSQVGLLMVVGLMLWANGNDVARWVEKRFGG